MTLEEIKEAVEVIKAYRQMLTDSVSNQIDEDIKAFDVAVEAMEREACEDAISRQAVLDAIEDDNRNGWNSCFASNNDAQCFKNTIRDLPPVNPQRMGHWIKDDITERSKSAYKHKCDRCGAYHRAMYDYCPSCGAKMFEPQERSGEE